MQWHALLGLSDADQLRGSYEADAPGVSKWEGDDPPTLDVVCSILLGHTEDPSLYFFGLCTIENWEESFTLNELSKPLLRLPAGRDYIVLAGPLSAVDQIENDGRANPGTARGHFKAVAFRSSAVEGAKSQADLVEPSWRDAPHLIWPADRSWFFASDVDFDSTLIGGGSELIEAVRSAELEAWQVTPTDSLAADADKINATPEDPAQTND